MKNNFTSLRITAGELKGREIKSPENSKTHPMGSRERLALMNIIGPDIKGATILDAFSGTGAIGIEALSRGAKQVTFIEKNPKVANLLMENLQNLNLMNQAKVLEDDVTKMELVIDYDFVIADPPYDGIDKIKPEVFEKLAKLAKKYFILSHPATFDPHSLGLKIIATKSYAAARITLFTF